MTKLVTEGNQSASFVIQADDRIPLNIVGLSPKRWLRYVDDYLYGGEEFNNFLPRDSKLVQSALRLKKLNPEEVKFSRLRRKIKSQNAVDIEGEEELISNFPRISTSDLARYLKITRNELRSFLRRNSIISGNLHRIGYSWSSYKDPELISCLKLLGIDRKKFPPMTELVKRRLERKNDE